LHVDYLVRRKRFRAIEINVNDGVNPEKLKNKIAEQLGKDFVVKNREEQNQGLYNVLAQKNGWSILF
jgi:lipoprotein-releasing system permease protein